MEQIERGQLSEQQDKILQGLEDLDREYGADQERGSECWEKVKALVEEVRAEKLLVNDPIWNALYETAKDAYDGTIDVQRFMESSETDREQQGETTKEPDERVTTKPGADRTVGDALSLFGIPTGDGEPEAPTQTVPSPRPPARTETPNSGDALNEFGIGEQQGDQRQETGNESADERVTPAEVGSWLSERLPKGLPFSFVLSDDQKTFSINPPESSQLSGVTKSLARGYTAAEGRRNNMGGIDFTLGSGQTFNRFDFVQTTYEALVRESGMIQPAEQTDAIISDIKAYQRAEALAAQNIRLLSAADLEILKKYGPDTDLHEQYIEGMPLLAGSADVITWGSSSENGVFILDEGWWSGGRIKTMCSEGFQYYNTQDPNVQFVVKKPVIYLYPTSEQEISVDVKLDGASLSTEYPRRGKNGWNVVADPSGKLTDTSTGKTHNYLFWEADSYDSLGFDQDKAHCVAGGEVEAFLEDTLATLGLNDVEQTDFITYWLPVMQKNPYNLIQFVKEEYEQMARLDVSPAPDTSIRVFMVFKGTDSSIETNPDPIVPASRDGYTLIEWGGANIDEGSRPVISL